MKFSSLKKFQSLLFFTKETLRQVEPDENALNFNLSYWLKRGDLILLKKGMYVFREVWEKEQDKTNFLEYLANKIYDPSYLSTEYVMQKYGLLTEGVFGLTSVSLNKTNSFNNLLGNFSYSNISPSFFCGYELKKFRQFPILIAKKEKAVFDYLYLRFLKAAVINDKVIEEFRINWENLSLTEFNKMKKFASFSSSLKIKKVIKSIGEKYYA